MCSLRTPSELGAWGFTRPSGELPSIRDQKLAAVGKESPAQDLGTGLNSSAPTRVGCPHPEALHSVGGVMMCVSPASQECVLLLCAG